MTEFQPFGAPHWAVLALTVAVGCVLVLNAKRLRVVRNDRIIRSVLAVGLIGNELLSWAVAFSHGSIGLPLHLCDVALFFMAWALMGKNRYAKELAFFWGLAGSSQAVLTPDLAEGFPSYPWLTFFLGHCGIVLSAVYLVARGLVTVSLRSVWRVWLISNVYVVIAMVVNWRLGTNFGYLARKPDHPSLLDYLGPWPYYIIGVEAIALGLFFLCLGFSRAVDRLAIRNVDG